MNYTRNAYIYIYIFIDRWIDKYRYRYIDIEVLTEIEINILEKDLDYAPIQNKINELKFKQDFQEFCRKMRLKWHFRSETTPEFSTTPAFNPKSTWKPRNSSPGLELF